MKNYNVYYITVNEVNYLLEKLDSSLDKILGENDSKGNVTLVQFLTGDGSSYQTFHSFKSDLKTLNRLMKERKKSIGPFGIWSNELKYRDLFN